MATTASNIVSIVCLFLVIGVHFSTTGEYSGLLSRLYKKASQNNRPLILVLDNSNREKQIEMVKTDYDVKEVSEDSNNNPLKYLYQMFQSQKKSPLKGSSKAKHIHVHEPKHQDKPRLRSRVKKQRLRSRDRLDKREDKERHENRLLRSPIMKTLLRMANGLNCEAKDECEDECNEKNGKEKDECEDVCEEKFECEEDKKDDECEESEDDCGESTTDNVEMSTQGEKLEPEEKNNCKRC